MTEDLENHDLNASDPPGPTESNPEAIRLLNERARLALKLGHAEKEIERLKEYESMYLGLCK